MSTLSLRGLRIQALVASGDTKYMHSEPLGQYRLMSPMAVGLSSMCPSEDILAECEAKPQVLINLGSWCR